ncbi:Efflux pump membrane transporter BepE [Bradyrhizobium ivorense]|uniref:Efflux pump membrane transporter n=1 Tax=Bradyrhizobium ivorense TaxID=2511166 RepID=A0A508T163_9BRAD|nr:MULTISPECIES: multidrug efflux RND transporter permease subunit [Bradyrhizobium]QOZ22764.1 hydrophobe/amphiphile efflux-1 family RND transporter [Bradyrhizobium sp. CCBAU 51753]VIO67133.1 Efflux pump membrane transporter BepE [Bradyrhizobium ivorense]VIO68210.1 Efflux pump membrane transporter BepE [Bradyrhizobium ivorense]
MNLGRLSINQPILAMVLSIVLLIVGAIAYQTLPVSEYPQVVPPTVTVTTQYPGASAQTVSDTVAAPIEQEINGVEDMLYLYSQATSNGQLTITVTFKLGTDLDKAQVLVQNRVAIAQPRLPEEVQRNGVVTRKNSPDILMVVFMLSPDDTFDQLYISNYALLQVRDQLLRIDGVGDIQMFGARDYSMRLWLDPDRIANLGLTSGEVLAAIRAQNLQIAGGQIAEPPIADRAFQPNLVFTGRLKDIRQFEDIVVKAGSDGRTVRLRDVARVELGALSYATNSFLLRKSAVALLVTQRPGSNALATAKHISDTMAQLKTSFPKGLDYNIGYNPTEFIAQSVHELIKTIYEAMALVVIVVLVFLQGWRPAIIPIIAIPVSLVGTFAVMAALGFSINNLTLFGLVLAVGIVVDDAIVVVENVERHLEHGMSRREAALKTMEEVGGALVSIALVLCAVFVPTAFLGGISGQFFQQFAVTIAVATAISCFCSLTLSPALASQILVPHEEKRPPARWNIIARGWDSFTGVFNRIFDRLAHGYAAAADFVIRHTVVMVAIYLVLIGSAGWLLATTPQGFIPAQDRGYVIISAQLPGAASLARTTAVVREIERIALDTPGIVRVAAFAGFSGATRTQAGNAAALFPVFDEPEARLKKGLTANAITAELRKRLSVIQGAFIIVIPPPAVPGIGTGGGFTIRVQDRQGRGPELLAAATDELVNAARKSPSLTSVFSPYSANTPQLFVDIDRVKAQKLGVPIANINDTIQTYFGSTYVNDFNLFGRTYHVTAQADQPFRKDSPDLSRLRTRNAAGDMVMLGSVVDFKDISGPDRVARYNLYSASELQGEPGPGVSSTTALNTIKQLADQTLPSGFSFEWTDLSYQQVTGGNAGLYVFPICVLFVYLVLAAQYGSWTLPFAVILIVPMCLFAATIGVRIMGQDVNILTQIGFVVLVGLAAKNAILIVEFARDIELEGRSRLEAVIEACRLRLRPILMTSFAFILGVLPLVVSTGSGSEMRQAVGVAVFFGMLGVTLFGLIFTPIFYMVVRNLAEGKNEGKKDQTTAAAAG